MYRLKFYETFRHVMKGHLRNVIKESRFNNSI